MLEVRQGSGITILSVENAEEFLSKSGERESINTIKGHIGRLMQEQKQLNARLQENINILLDANDRFNYLNPITPFELTIGQNCPLVGQTIASTRFWNNTGATIVAIHRAGRTILSPGPHAQFFAGDKLLIVGMRPLTSGRWSLCGAGSPCTPRYAGAPREHGLAMLGAPGEFMWGW